MRITVKYFAIVREAIGRSEEHLDLPEASTAGDAIDSIARAYPAVERLTSILMVMVNQEYASRGQVLRAGDELALIPPVSGGAGARFFRVQRDVIDPRMVERVVAGAEVGGIVTFSGTVRDRARGKAVIALDYEAYEPVAENMLARIGDEVHTRWGVDRVAIVHRIGRLPVGEISVVISAAAAHRAAAFDACEYAIDRIKVLVPIWKKEFYADGSHWVGTEAEYQRESSDPRLD
ncbi:MAG: MoaD family protein [Chloroflexia bacterium]|nr:MoaD family protein [Chloroflexia bacterium]